MRVSEFIEQCDGANAADQVFEVYRTAAARFGYDRLALVPVTPPARQALGVAGSLPAVGIGANIPELRGSTTWRTPTTLAIRCCCKRRVAPSRCCGTASSSRRGCRASSAEC